MNGAANEIKTLSIHDSKTFHCHKAFFDESPMLSTRNIDVSGFLP